mgnify:FL=1
MVHKLDINMSTGIKPCVLNISNKEGLEYLFCYSERIVTIDITQIPLKLELIDNFKNNNTL